MIVMTTSDVKRALLVGLVASVVACTGTARGLEAYRTDTSTLLDSRRPQVKACYDEALKTDATLAGTVTVQFVVEKQTGAITNATVATDKTTAPAALGRCVVKAIAGLVLAPGDRNEGRATFVYELTPAATPRS
jgi:hypothetical protein